MERNACTNVCILLYYTNDKVTEADLRYLLGTNSEIWKPPLYITTHGTTMNHHDFILKQSPNCRKVKRRRVEIMFCFIQVLSVQVLDGSRLLGSSHSADARHRGSMLQACEGSSPFRADAVLILCIILDTGAPSLA